MAENCGNLKTSWALNVHEERIGRLNKSLQLVGSGLAFGSWVQEIDRHIGICVCVFYR